MDTSLARRKGRRFSYFPLLVRGLGELLAVEKTWKKSSGIFVLERGRLGRASGTAPPFLVEPSWIATPQRPLSRMKILEESVWLFLNFCNGQKLVRPFPVPIKIWKITFSVPCARRTAPRRPQNSAGMPLNYRSEIVCSVYRVIIWTLHGFAVFHTFNLITIMKFFVVFISFHSYNRRFFLRSVILSCCHDHIEFSNGHKTRFMCAFRSTVFVPVNRKRAMWCCTLIPTGIVTRQAAVVAVVVLVAEVAVVAVVVGRKVTVSAPGVAVAADFRVWLTRTTTNHPWRENGIPTLCTADRNPILHHRFEYNAYTHTGQYTQTYIQT